MKIFRTARTILYIVAASFLLNFPTQALSVRPEMS